jgi:hypothetical protein
LPGQRAGAPSALDLLRMLVDLMFSLSLLVPAYGFGRGVLSYPAYKPTYIVCNRGSGTWCTHGPSLSRMSKRTRLLLELI